MDHRVAIIGGGISGLSAGHHLAESGLKPVVFESESFVGGRMSSERVNGFIIDKGAYTLPESYRNLRRFVDQLGIGSLVQTPGTSSIFAEGEEHPFKVGSPADFLRFRPLSLKSKKDVVKLFFYAQSLRSALNLGRPSQKTFELEDETAADYLLKHHYDPQLVERIAYPLFCELFLGTPEKNSKLALLATLKTLTSFKIFAFEEGMGTLPETLSSHMEIRVETPVLRIDIKGEKGPYEIHTGGRRPSSHIFDSAVLAVPFPLIPRMIPQLPSDLRDYCRHVPYSPSIVVALATERRLSQISMISNLLRTDFKTLGTLICDSHKSSGRVPEGRGLLTAILCEGASRALFRASDEQVSAEVIKELELFLPKFSEKLLFVKIYRWEQGALQLPPGHLLNRVSVRQYFDNGMGNLYFAGESFPVSSLEASFNSGIQAAKRIISKMPR